LGKIKFKLSKSALPAARTVQILVLIFYCAELLEVFMQYIKIA